MSGYVPTIGIECHVQLKTKTKLFAAVANDAREAEPNTLISHICLGMPGALPVLNKEAITLGIRAAFALSTKPQKFSNFDRKHYFYPDLPKGYQISQFNHPIIKDGFVDIEVDGDKKRIGITRAHLEEDAGKSTHPDGKDYSLVDLNRAGTPLLEIVSEPDMHSALEAKAFARELYLLMKYADVSDADLYYGNMRFDVNVSVSNDPQRPGIRTETKNLNSFRSVEKSIEYEIKRQTAELEKGNIILQETRGWDEAKQKTVVQRTKEEAHDYRYFPDPDIPPIILNDSEINRHVKEIKNFPADIRRSLRKLQIDSSAIETIVESIPAAKLIMEAVELDSSVADLRRIALWLAGEVQAYVADKSLAWEDLKLDVNGLLKLSSLVSESKVSSTGAKIVLLDMIQNGGEPLEIAQRLEVIQVSDEKHLVALVQKVIAANEQAANDVKNGEKKALGFLVGQVMKESKGQANPVKVNEILNNLLQP